MVPFLASAPYASLSMAWNSASTSSWASGGSGRHLPHCPRVPSFLLAPLAPNAPPHFGFQFGPGMPHPWGVQGQGG